MTQDQYIKTTVVNAIPAPIPNPMLLFGIGSIWPAELIYRL